MSFSFFCFCRTSGRGAVTTYRLKILNAPFRRSPFTEPEQKIICTSTTKYQQGVNSNSYADLTRPAHNGADEGRKPKKRAVLTAYKRLRHRENQRGSDELFSHRRTRTERGEQTAATEGGWVTTKPRRKNFCRENGSPVPKRFCEGGARGA